MLSRWRLLTRPAIRAYSTPSPTEPLAGSVAPHKLYLLLHSQRPITELASRPVSAVQRALQLELTPGAFVNFTWRDAHGRGRFPIDAEGSGEGETEAYAATAYTREGRIDINTISLANVKQVVETLRSPSPGLVSQDDAVHLYVCTHGARDCRCGDTGTAVFRALQEGIAQKVGAEAAPDSWRRMRIGEVAHVGGHKCVVLYVPFFVS
jgi:hypothetical protein